MTTLVLRRWLRRVPAYALLALCAAVLLFPLYITVIYSLHPIAEFLNDPPPRLWPSSNSTRVLSARFHL